ncbi:hypothetical protein M422DRAFT_30174 [Sphaerobolus stellatus SS14]|uniref:Cytochrome P450 n=1 Tax=Sphaerobolus stellatus (strain SS14) TaxID=990650 RepID=A0A0C9VDA5_SPHS4|nr:hypothetical protein M422DRAFT_30174 [Sphaerobolus stellatus SS14]
MYWILSFLGLCLAAHHFWQRATRRLPPGPKGIPLLGNILDQPTTHEWIHWGKHKEVYGPISSVTVLGQTIVILNDLKTCMELLEKRSADYAGRPRLPFAGEMIGWNRQMILAPYGEHFLSMRKLVARHIGTRKSLVEFQSIQETEIRRFLFRVYEHPRTLLRSIRLFQGAIFLRISHGYIVNTSSPDSLIQVIEQASQEFYEATRPGSWIVDLFPLLARLPAWFPGTTFKHIGEQYRKTNDAQMNLPFNWAKAQMAAGTARPSFTSKCLMVESDPASEELIKLTGNLLYGGGTDTVTATLSTFFLAMTLYPAVQKKAQAEIAGITGGSRLPTFNDRDHLPYINALITELFRWHIAGPMGIPHCSLTDDYYNGYYIPKGSIVLSNIWKISQEEEHYKEPEKFKPERFLGDASELDPHTYAFGFGRRRCPGIELAVSSVYIAVVMSLAVFEILPAKDSQTGERVMPVHEYASGTVSHPKDFVCDIVPHSSEAEALIRTINNEDHPPPSTL